MPLLSDKVEKYCINRQAIHDNTIRPMRYACRITRARIQIHIQNMQHLLLFHCNNGLSNPPPLRLNVHCLSCFVLLLWCQTGWQSITSKQYRSGKYGPRRLFFLKAGLECVLLHAVQVTRHIYASHDTVSGRACNSLSSVLLNKYRWHFLAFL